MVTPCEAVAKRINELLKQNKITWHKLELNSGVRHGTMARIKGNKNISVDFATVLAVAGGFDMHVSEFLNSPIFDEENVKV